MMEIVFLVINIYNMEINSQIGRLLFQYLFYQSVLILCYRNLFICILYLNYEPTACCQYKYVTQEMKSVQSKSYTIPFGPWKSQKDIIIHVPPHNRDQRARKTSEIVFTKIFYTFIYSSINNNTQTKYCLNQVQGMN